jgi:hypothetical protein
MCGICGAIDFSEAADAVALVRRMTPAMTHRGPDDEGYLTDRGLAIGMRWLMVYCGMFAGSVLPRGVPSKSLSKLTRVRPYFSATEY